MKHYTATPISTRRFQLGEAPFYDENTDRISFVDITAGAFFLMTSDGRIEEFNLGQAIGAAVPAEKPGTYMLAAKDGLYLYEEGNARKVYDLQKYYLDYQRSNDAKADPMGRLYIGSVTGDDDHPQSGNLYCCDGRMRILQADTKIANGMAWSSDRKKFYFSDSMDHAVYIYDYDILTGVIVNRKILFTIENGVPDGMCIDSEDNLWLAIWGGSRIECHSGASGELLAVIDVPAEHVTSCCFYGESGKLFITSSGDGLSGEYDGALFSCEVEVQGVLADRAKLTEKYIVTKADWDFVPMPFRKARFTLKRHFDEAELTNLKQGYMPRDMDDRWVSYYEDNRLYIHRSWSGHCIYIVEINSASDEHEVMVNRDKSQYTCDSLQEDKELLCSLIQMFVSDNY